MTPPPTSLNPGTNAPENMPQDGMSSTAPNEVVAASGVNPKKRSYQRATSSNQLSANVSAKLHELYSRPEYHHWQLGGQLMDQLARLSEKDALDAIERFSNTEARSIRNRDGYMKGIINNVLEEKDMGDDMDDDHSGELGKGQQHAIVTETIETLEKQGAFKQPLDERLVHQLHRQPYECACEIMAEFKASDFRRIYNINGYLRSIMKKRGREPQKPALNYGNMSQALRRRLEVLAKDKVLHYHEDLRVSTREKFQQLPDFVQVVLLSKFASPQVPPEKTKNDLMLEYITEVQEHQPLSEYSGEDNARMFRYGYAPPCSQLKSQEEPQPVVELSERLEKALAEFLGRVGLAREVVDLEMLTQFNEDQVVQVLETLDNCDNSNVNENILNCISQLHHASVAAQAASTASEAAEPDEATSTSLDI